MKKMITKNIAFTLLITVLFSVFSYAQRSMDLSSLTVIISDEIESPIDETIKEIISTKIENHSKKKIKISDVAQEILKLKEELKYTQGFLKSVQGKLKNQKFVSGAPQQVVDNERKKEADAIAKIETIETSIKSLS